MSELNDLSPERFPCPEDYEKAAYYGRERGKGYRII